jgi:hypothetical protein
MHSSAYVRNIHSEHLCTLNEPSPTLHYLIKNLQKYAQAGTNSNKFFEVSNTINHPAVLKM